MIDYSSKNMRWIVLFLCCWLLFGNYYAFDNPSSLNRQLMIWLESDYATYQYQLSALYSVYSIPNIVLPLFTGTFIDKYGLHRLLVFLSALVGIGQGIFALGVQFKMFWLMLLGRIVFGLGGESLTVAQTRLVTEWFKGKELSLAIGLTLSVARFGTVFNNFFSPLFAEHYSVPFATWIGFLSCVWSLMCACITVSIDRQYSCLQYHDIESTRNVSSNHAEQDTLTLLEVLKSMKIIVKTYHPAFWILCLASFSFYGAIVPFNNVASDLLQSKYYKDDPYTSGLAMSIPDTLAIFLVPLIGTFVDQYGYKLVIIYMGGICMALGHLIIASLLSSSPILPLLLNGIANSTMLALVPCVSLLVPELYWGSAYGVLSICGNASCSLVPIGVAILLSYDATFYLVEMYFATLAISGTLLSVILGSMNRDQLLGLNESEATVGSEVWKKSHLRLPSFALAPEPLLVHPDTAYLMHASPYGHEHYSTGGDKVTKVYAETSHGSSHEMLWDGNKPSSKYQSIYPSISGNF